MRIDYNMTKEYRSHWSAYDAIREMVQNASDKQNYECKIAFDTTISVVNEGLIPLETLMLGESQKSSDSVGRYGEGYKIGMMILTREGLNPVIHTGKHKLTGSFELNDLGVESFGINVEDAEEMKSTGFSCDVGHLDLDELKRRLPAFEKPLPLPKTVDVLTDRPGQIYVNGLWVCSAKLTHGYNFHPNHIELNTDRNMVSGVTWQLAQFYGKLGAKHAEHIFRLIEADATDVADLSYWLSNKELMAELQRLFYNKYGEGAKIAKPGTTYIGGGSYVSASYNTARAYTKCGIKEPKQAVDPEAPHALLQQFLEQNKSKLRRDVRNRLESLIERSKGWKKPDVF